jgi:hypothetical protein
MSLENRVSADDGAGAKNRHFAAMAGLQKLA